MIRRIRTTLNWKYALGEILLIFIGISLAIAFQNWNDKRRELREGKELAERLLLEVKQNQIGLTQSIDNTKNLISHLERLLSMFGTEYQKYSPEQTDSMIYQAILGTPRMALSYGTLLEGFNSGKISLMKSQDLKTLLYSWQKQVDDAKNFESILENENAGQILPYLYDHFSLRQMDNRYSFFQNNLEASKLPQTDNRKVLAERKFENMMENKYFMYNLMLSLYQQVDEGLKQISDLLIEEKAD